MVHDKLTKDEKKILQQFKHTSYPQIYKTDKTDNILFIELIDFDICDYLLKHKTIDTKKYDEIMQKYSMFLTHVNINEFDDYTLIHLNNVKQIMSIFKKYYENQYFVKSITNLYQELSKLEKIKPNISFDKNIITMLFHHDFKIEISYSKYIGFNLYINSIFESNIEEQDIIPFVMEIIENTVIVQYKKLSFFRKPFKFIRKERFNKNDWMDKTNVKIFTTSETIISNF